MDDPSSLTLWMTCPAQVELQLFDVLWQPLNKGQEYNLRLADCRLGIHIILALLRFKPAPVCAG